MTARFAGGSVGNVDGILVDFNDGNNVGAEVERAVGLDVGLAVGFDDGIEVGLNDGNNVGTEVGRAVG